VVIGTLLVFVDVKFGTDRDRKFGDGGVLESDDVKLVDDVDDSVIGTWLDINLSGIWSEVLVWKLFPRGGLQIWCHTNCCLCPDAPEVNMYNEGPSGRPLELGFLITLVVE